MAATDTAEQQVAQAMAGSAESSFSMELSQDQLDEVQDQLEEIKQLLLTPQGRRPGWNGRPGGDDQGGNGNGNGNGH